MNLSDISAKVTSLTGADTNQYTNAERLVDLNIWQKNIVGMILDSQDEADYDDPNWGDYPRFTFPLTTNRDYFIPITESVLKYKDVSVSYDGVNVYRATPLEYSANELADAPDSATAQNNFIDSQYSRVAPRYDVKFGALFIYPRATAADVAAGAYGFVEWFRQAKDITLSDLTTGTLIPGFDDNFHVMLAYGMACEYLLGKDMKRYAEAKKGLTEYEVRLRRQYSSKQLDRTAALSGSYQSMK